MKIRDGHAVINGDETTFTAKSGSIDIIADDGRALFDITLNKDGTISIFAVGSVKHQKVILDDCLFIKPVSSNMIIVSRRVYKNAR